MKQFFAIFALVFCSFSLFAANAATKSTPTSQVSDAATQTDMAKGGMDQLMSLTPKKYEEMTGKKMNWVQKLKFKAAQKLMKKQQKKAAGGEISKGLYIVLAIIGLGWLAMGVNDDWQGSDWIISLVLYFLFWLPGLIYTLIKMKKYY